MKNVFIEHSSAAYAYLMRSLGFNVVSNFDQADIVLFTGGADVSPSLYGAAQHKFTMNDAYRDNKEAHVFKHCVEKNIPMVGICRGGQFLNVMSGGEMFQHVSKHAGHDHEIVDLQSGETILVSSTHHQMMKPSSEAVLVASSYLHGEREWYEGQIFKRDISDQDYEVVFYPKFNALCFQPHPEFGGDQYARMKSYFRECMNNYLGV